MKRLNKILFIVLIGCSFIVTNIFISNYIKTMENKNISNRKFITSENKGEDDDNPISIVKKNINRTGFKEKENKELKPEEKKWMEQNVIVPTKIVPNKYYKGNDNKDENLPNIGNDIVEYTDYKGDNKRSISNNYASIQPLESEELPDFVDNSQRDAFPEIRSQGFISSSYSFATTYYQMTYMEALQNGWNTKNSLNNNKMSPRWTYNLSNGGSTLQSSYIDNYRILKEHGCALWSDFPYDGDILDSKNYLEWCTNGDIWRNATKYRIDKVGIATIGKGSDKTAIKGPKDSSLNNVKQLLNNGYVINVGTHIYSWNYAKAKDDKTTDKDNKYVGMKLATSMNGVDGINSMILVGYDDNIWVDINNDNKVQEGEKGAFKVANCRGKKFGKDGFYWVSYDAFNKVSSVKGVVNSEGRESIFDNSFIFITVRNQTTPKVMAQFTLNHSDRSQINIELGISDLESSNPQQIYKIDALTSESRVAFDGGYDAVDATFTIDYDNILNLYSNINLDKGKKFYITVKDNKVGNPLVVKDFSLVDENGKKLAKCVNSLPSKPVDNSSITLYANYKTSNYTKNIEGATFENKQTMQVKRANPIVFTFNNKIYAMGGDTGDTHSIEVYDPDTDKWTIKGNIPSGIDISVTVWHEKKIYAIDQTAGKIYIYNPIDNSFKLQYDKLEPAIALKAISYKDKIYLMSGGTVETEKGIIQEYNPIKKEIKTKLEIPKIGPLKSIETLDDEIYIIGDLQGFGVDSQVTKAYNVVTNKLEDKGLLNQKIAHNRYYFDNSLVNLNNKLYKIGNTIELYDKTKDKWEVVYYDMLRYSDYSVTILNNKVFLIGGSIDVGAGEPTNEVKVLNIK
ncbi:Kelch motif-containing protein [Clostridium cavendishii DSM 21758]|uniref:Kelch motif-containing protein n=1 Tax=Clostridium cavendishii DSM 21758 TaxID=1121302 RepID=A0A1M6J4U9_9CLOT|nr:hypothetical protein [Clostridium cavendishii]SHJ41651.1 Kelch motif-containing protein [Clostridium cavendishii DSM 21758]